MFKIYKYFFFKVYSFSLFYGQKDTTGAFSLVMMLSIVNLYTFFDVILIFTQTPLPQVNSFTIILIFSPLVLLNYNLLLKGQKTKQIMEEFNTNKKQRWMWNLILLSYIILSIYLSIYTSQKAMDINE